MPRKKKKIYSIPGQDKRWKIGEVCKNVHKYHSLSDVLQYPHYTGEEIIESNGFICAVYPYKGSIPVGSLGDSKNNYPYRTIQEYFKNKKEPILKLCFNPGLLLQLAKAMGWAEYGNEGIVLSFNPEEQPLPPLFVEPIDFYGNSAKGILMPMSKMKDFSSDNKKAYKTYKKYQQALIKFEEIKVKMEKVKPEIDAITKHMENMK
jgi:hypothetical protein